MPFTEKENKFMGEYYGLSLETELNCTWNENADVLEIGASEERSELEICT